MSVARQTSPIQMAKRFSIGERRLLNWNRGGVLSSLSFTDNNGVRYFNQAWLRKAMDIVKGKRRNVN